MHANESVLKLWWSLNGKSMSSRHQKKYEVDTEAYHLLTVALVEIGLAKILSSQ